MIPRRFVLLDRDGTLIVEKNYLSDPDQVELIPGAAAGLRRLAGCGLGLVVLTNQSGIGRGFFDEAKLAEIHQRLTGLLRTERVELDGIYFCPHHPDQACGCRKPQPELALRAAAELGFDAARARSAAPEWAAVQRIDLADAERLAAWRRGSDAAQRHSARAELADHAWRIGDFAGSLAIDEEWLAEEPAAFEPAWRRVDALLMLGRPGEALRAAEVLADAHPERTKSRRWYARAKRAVARERSRPQ